MEFSTMPRFTAISAHSSIKATPIAIKIWLMSSRPDSRAHPFPPPANDSDPTIRETCGPPPANVFAELDPDTSSWKTHPSYDALDGRKITPRRRKPHTLGKYLATWPRMGMMRNGVVSALQTWGCRTNATGSGFLPTPMGYGKGSSRRPGINALDIRVRGMYKDNPRYWPRETLPTPTTMDAHGFCGKPDKGRTGPNSGRTLLGRVLELQGMGPHARSADSPKANVNGGLTKWKESETEEMIPTPTAADRAGGPGNQGREGGINLKTYVANLPTPTGNMMTMGDMEQAKFAGSDPKRPAYTDVNGGLLNPNWEEQYLMLWPIGWSALRPLAEDKFRLWLALHGKS